MQTATVCRTLAGAQALQGLGCLQQSGADDSYFFELPAILTFTIIRCSPYGVRPRMKSASASAIYSVLPQILRPLDFHYPRASEALTFPGFLQKFFLDFLFWSCWRIRTAGLIFTKEIWLRYLLPKSVKNGLMRALFYGVGQQWSAALAESFISRLKLQS